MLNGKVILNQHFQAFRLEHLRAQQSICDIFLYIILFGWLLNLSIHHLLIIDYFLIPIR
jgi:hypothetical protein